MDHIRKTVETFVAKAEQLERDLLDTKRTVNMLLKQLGDPPRYNLETKSDETAAVHGSWRTDEFYGQPLASVVKRILLARKAAGLGAASINDIFEAMKAGGFQFGSQDDVNAKTVLRQSLRKNTAVFHRLPSNGNYGLKEWYPNVKEKPKTNGDNGGKEEGDDEPGETVFVAPPAAPPERVVTRNGRHEKAKSGVDPS
jgi:hypothetical protein